jgi:hypothetical protein
MARMPKILAVEESEEEIELRRSKRLRISEEL